jgi:hypothetical protein
MKDNEKIKQLIKLSEEHPDLEIFAKVHSDCVQSEDFQWWQASIGNSEVDEYWQPSEETFIGQGDIYDELAMVYESEIDGMPSDKEDEFLTQKYEELKASGDIKKSIFVTIAP